MAKLLEPLTLRGTTFANRIWASPTCQYSCDPDLAPGVPTDWHLVHLGGLAVGGCGLVLTEAAAVVPEGRITPQDAGLWNEEQTRAWTRVVDFAHSQGVAIGVQLAHAGRKASTHRPWAEQQGSVPPAEGGWETVGPSALAFGDHAVPTALDEAGLERVVTAFADAARRAETAGFDVVELHAAHGYLLHQFLSPLSNHRTDGYGGDLAGRSRLLLEVLDAVRAVWPRDKPVLVRLSTSDWVEGGWDVAESVELTRELAARGADLVDASSGGNDPRQRIPVGPGYQVPAAARIRRETGVPVAAVGLILEPAQAEQVLVSGDADAVFLARPLLADPRWPQRAAQALHAPEAVAWPPQYVRATRAPVPHVSPRQARRGADGTP
ncbi:NADH:flavin oxidoreductase/NADH oxidase [Kineococcus radiotolerans]|uniref:NADH:flavin oxidoreductase/NADH oxidase n=1 Tax=Kineococcus radiotolerans (strain ATCC BAA-149 / DSM 14245 / SRS30216) TaxID=266940 RepID=A6WEJ9_KINRD|nr:NADH:flavin oxidoreductase/NADH oxidase [Kineococcus radiotolerans]ABS05238.1 NADH:flavin oxidoreductase/NADH oxidase [Kineococcus radiotolerans SRS30216 = ATCC BAA-149]